MHVGQAFNVYNVLGTTYPIWRVEACSSSTNTRPYANFQKQSWQLAGADISDFIHQKLGNLQLTEDVRGPGLSQWLIRVASDEFVKFTLC
jgi:hypothetical protein